MSEAEAQNNVTETNQQQNKKNNDNNTTNKQHFNKNKNKKHNKHQNQEDEKVPEFTRELDLEKYPRMEYKTSKQRPNVLKGIHLGQRKLLLSEIEFLTLSAKGQLFDLPSSSSSSSSQTTKNSFHFVIYAGAAPGGHDPFLRSLFSKNVSFLLIDPAPFDKDLLAISTVVDANKNNNNNNSKNTTCFIPEKASEILVLQDYCTPELCARIQEQCFQVRKSKHGLLQSVLFISDIRVGDMSRNLTNAQATEIIMKDNELQKGCCQALKPEAAMLKFRPPFPRETNTASPRFDASDATPDHIEYLDGRIFFGVWAPKSSTEVRLVVTDFSSKRKYHCKSFEEQMCFYNAHNRYLSDVAAERHILSEYLSLSSSSSNSKMTVEDLSRKVSAALYNGSELFQPLLVDSSFPETDARLWAFLFVGCYNAQTSNTSSSSSSSSSATSAASSASATAEETADNLFKRLRSHVTIERVLSGAHPDTPQQQTQNQKQQNQNQNQNNNTSSSSTSSSVPQEMKEFWKCANASRLGEFYQFLPWLHGNIIPRKHNNQKKEEGEEEKGSSNSKVKKEEEGGGELPQRRKRD